MFLSFPEEDPELPLPDEPEPGFDEDPAFSELLSMNRRPLSRTKAHLSRENPRVPIHLTPPLRLVAAVLARDLRTLLPHQMVDHRLLTAVRRMQDLHRTQVLVRRAVAIRGLLLETALLVRVRLLALPAAVPPLLVLAINGHQASQA